MPDMTLDFEGFVQVRLATDPDPSDEPRGVSGWTHAAAGEPDLDRVLVLQDDEGRRVRRSRGPAVGVTVRAVGGDTRHPLVGAPVRLLDGPKFEGRNWIVASDGFEPIDPLHLHIAGAGVVLDKRHLLTGPAGDPVPFYRITPEELARRTPSLEADADAQREIFTALGIPDGGPAAWRQARKTQLQQDLDELPPAEVETATALRLRITDLDIGGPAVRTVGVRMRYSLALSGPGRATDDAQVFRDRVDADSDWPIDFWVGGWDADALCMYMRGRLSLPLA
jgi:hypothetical protein